MSIEVVQAVTWVVTTAKADTALMAASVGGVWNQLAPISTASPYTLITEQVPGNDTLTMNAVRLFTKMVLQIKAVGPASNYSELATIADRIDALFKGNRNISLTPGYVLSSYRTSAISYGELRNGQLWSHLGGLYHIDLQGS